MKRLTQAQSEVNEAKAVIEKLKQSKAEARAEKENSKRALAEDPSSTAMVSPSGPSRPHNWSGYDSSISNTPSSADKSRNQMGTAVMGSEGTIFYSNTMLISYVLGNQF